MIGDSCTFGLIVAENFTYPVVTETALRRMGRDVEVINAGVEGYSPFNVLKRIDHYLSFDPDIVTIYLGWNAIFDDEEGLRSNWLTQNFMTAYVVEKGYRRLTGHGEYRSARELYARKARYDPGSEDAARARNYRPSFLPSMVAILERIRQSGATPVLITLPGLFATDQSPSPLSVDIGHLPYFTSNAFVLAQMAANYNQALREMAIKAGIPLMDLDRWSRGAFPDPENWFFDSVHLKAAGQVRIGEHLARELLPVLDSRVAHAETIKPLGVKEISPSQRAATP
jgi:lysophospholipase L1-like esterase